VSPIDFTASYRSEASTSSLACPEHEACFHEVLEYAACELIVVAMELPEGLGLGDDLVLAYEAVNGFPERPVETVWLSERRWTRRRNVRSAIPNMSAATFRLTPCRSRFRGGGRELSPGKNAELRADAIATTHARRTEFGLRRWGPAHPRVGD